MGDGGWFRLSANAGEGSVGAAAVAGAFRDDVQMDRPDPDRHCSRPRRFEGGRRRRWGLSRYTLHGHYGWGSVLTEAQLAWYGFPFDFIDVGDLFEDPAARKKLGELNPLKQVPVLILPDGEVMTETAAITFHLADAAKSHDLVPAPHEPTRPRFLRWLIFIVANVYPTFTYGDVPERFVPGAEAAQGFRAHLDDYQKALWRMVEREAQAPWFLNERFSALDIYLCAMARWRPNRSWFEKNAPRLVGAADRCNELPKLTAVWRRNYPPAAG